MKITNRRKLPKAKLNSFFYILFCSFFICFNFHTDFIKAQTTTNYIWKNVNFGGGGFVSGIVTSKAEKNLIYARTDVGGAYRWIESSKSWKPLLDWASPEEWTFMGVESIAIDPSAPNKVYMSVGLYYAAPSAILRSNDYGETFQKTNVDFQINGNGMGRNNGERLAVDPKNGNILFCGSRDGGLWQSTDGAVSWTSNTTFPVPFTDNRNGISFVIFDELSTVKNNATQRIFVGVSQLNSSNLYVSETGGATWSPVANQPASTLMPQRATKAGNYLYITYADAEGPSNPTKGAIYRYNTITGEWKNISPSTLPFSGISVDNSNPLKLMASTINMYQKQVWDGGSVYGDNIYRSTDGGTTWTNLCQGNHLTADVAKHPWIGTAPQLHWVSDIQIDPFNSERVLLTSGNGLFMTENISATKSTWTFQVDGLEETVPLDMISIKNGLTIAVVFDYNGFIHNDPTVAPATTLKSSMGSTTGIDFAESNSNLGVVVGNVNCKYTLNAGTTWSAVITKPESTATKGNVAISSDGGTIYWFPAGGKNTYYTKDYGATWFPLLAGVTVKGRPVADKVNPNKVYVAQATNLYECVWNGSTYSYTTISIPIINSAIRTIPGIEGDVWLPNTYNGLSHYTNVAGVKTLTKIPTLTTCEAVGFGKEAVGKTYPTLYIWGTPVNGVMGVYRSDDKGATWTRVNDDKHQFGGMGDGAFVVGDRTKYGRVYLSTAGRGLIYGEIASNTAVYESRLANESKIFPNPALYTIQVTGEFNSLDIYTLNGIKVLSSTETTINVESLKRGTYIAKMHNLHETHSQLFVKL